MSELAVHAPTVRPRAAALRLLGEGLLCREAAAGDRDAFAAIFERYQQPLYRYCRSITGDREDASDALQSTMVAAMRGLEGETREIALKPWLYRIAHNESVSLIRARRAHAGLEQAAELPAPDPQADAAVRERLGQLVSDLRSLPDRQRGALVMRELSGLEYAEIATALGTSAATAKQAVYEARTALHDFAKGREMDCDAAMRAISARDGRMLRGRQMRTHLRACGDCRDFRDAIGARRTDLAALAPPLPAATAAALLEGVLGGGGGGGVGGGPLGALAAGAGKLAGASVAAKGLAAGAAAVIAAAGAIELASAGRSTAGGTGAPAAHDGGRTAGAGADRVWPRERRRTERKAGRRTAAERAAERSRSNRGRPRDGQPAVKPPASPRGWRPPMPATGQPPAGAPAPRQPAGTRRDGGGVRNRRPAGGDQRAPRRAVPQGPRSPAPAPAPPQTPTAPPVPGA